MEGLKIGPVKTALQEGLNRSPRVSRLQYNRLQNLFEHVRNLFVLVVYVFFGGLKTIQYDSNTGEHPDNLSGSVFIVKMVGFEDLPTEIA